MTSLHKWKALHAELFHQRIMTTENCEECTWEAQLGAFILQQRVHTCLSARTTHLKMSQVWESQPRALFKESWGEEATDGRENNEEPEGGGNPQE